MNLLSRSSLRYLGAHRWQFGLSVLGVALGVAVVVSVDLANESASRAFDLSNDVVTGRTTHQVVGGPNGIPEASYTTLRRDLGLRLVAPVVEGYVSAGSAEGFDRPLRLLGIDPFTESAFRADLQTGPTQLDIREFLTVPGSVLLSPGTAERLGVGPGERLAVRFGATRRHLRIAGLLATDDSVDEGAIADLLVSDISTAQETLDMVGRLSRLDLILEDGAAGAARLAASDAALPAGARLVEAAARTETTRQMTRAFRINLTALSLLALVCGVFLVYNTMSFSVVQRRQLIGTMRAIGVTRQEVFRLVLSEAAAIGIAGTVVGIVGGIAIGRILVGLVTQTINDLYFVVAVRDLAIAPLSLAKGFGLGIGGAVAAALAPATEATGAPPRAVLLRSQVEARARRKAAPAAWSGLAFLTSGALLLGVAGADLLLSFAALFMTILGFALLTPAAVILAMRVATPPMGWALGPLGRLATRGVTAALSRTAVAIAALMIAISVVIGVGIMIDSFRGTVSRWLDAVLVADLYISPLAPGAGSPAMSLSDEQRAAVQAIPGVERISTVRSVDLPAADGGRTRLIVFDIDARGRRGFEFSDGDPESAWESFLAGDGVLVTEPYAYRNEVRVDDEIVLPTERGEVPFTIAGVYYNYASEEGLVAMDRNVYERHWDDRSISGFAVYADPGADLLAIGDRIRALLADRELRLQSNRSLRQTSLEVFDRTFLITGVLRLLVTLVAVVGVLSALMSLQLERAREIGVLRALGLTPNEVWRLTTSQSGLIGLVSGAFALPVGLTLATIMIYVINRRSFGWTLRMEIDPGILVQALVLAAMAALLAGIYPSLRMSRTPPATALREE